MKMAGAGDKGRYPSRLAITRKSTSTSKTFWDRKTSRRISAPTTNSTWPIFPWPETLTSAWSGAARFKKHNNTCGTAESITSAPRATSPAHGDPQRACISGIPMATSGSSWCTRNKFPSSARRGMLVRTGAAARTGSDARALPLRELFRPSPRSHCPRKRSARGVRSSRD